MLSRFTQTSKTQCSIFETWMRCPCSLLWMGKRIDGGFSLELLMDRRGLEKLFLRCGSATLVSPTFLIQYLCNHDISNFPLECLQHHFCLDACFRYRNPGAVRMPHCSPRKESTAEPQRPKPMSFARQAFFLAVAQDRQVAPLSQFPLSSSRASEAAAAAFENIFTVHTCSVYSTRLPRGTLRVR